MPLVSLTKARLTRVITAVMMEAKAGTMELAVFVMSSVMIKGAEPTKMMVADRQRIITDFNMG